MNIKRLLSVVSMVAVSPLLAQTSAPLPAKLAGQYLWENNRKESRVEVIPVELSEITTIGDYVKGVVSYRALWETAYPTTPRSRARTRMEFSASNQTR